MNIRTGAAIPSFDPKAATPPTEKSPLLNKERQSSVDSTGSGTTAPLTRSSGSSVDSVGSEVKSSSGIAATHETSAWSRFSFKKAASSGIRNLTSGIASLALKFGKLLSDYHLFVPNDPIELNDQTDFSKIGGRKFWFQASTKVKKTFEETPSGPEKTVTVMSASSNTLKKMGYYINPDDMMPTPDATIPTGGFARVYGKQERAIMAKTVNSSTSQTRDQAITTIKEKLIVQEDAAKGNKEKQAVYEQMQKDTEGYDNWSHYKLLAYNKADSLDWDRFSLQAPEEKVSSSKFNDRTPTQNLTTFKKINLSKLNNRTTQNLTAFKEAIKLLRNSDPTDQEAYEMMCLVDQESLSGGFPQGSNHKTGLACGQERVGKYAENVVKLTLSENSSIHFNYTSADAYLNSITLPDTSSNGAPTTPKLSSVAVYDTSGRMCGNNIDRTTTNLPQFKVSMKYTYAYTPSNNEAQKGSTSLLDSRMAFWPISVKPSEDDPNK